jgi:hypothetical protein
MGGAGRSGIERPGRLPVFQPEDAAISGKLFFGNDLKDEAECSIFRNAPLCA